MNLIPIKRPFRGSIVAIAAAVSALALGLVAAPSAGAALQAELVHDLNPGPSSSYPNNRAVLGDHMFFEATDGVHGEELWKSDGVNATMVADIRPGA